MFHLIQYSNKKTNLSKIKLILNLETKHYILKTKNDNFLQTSCHKVLQDIKKSFEDVHLDAKIYEISHILLVQLLELWTLVSSPIDGWFESCQKHFIILSFYKVACQLPKQPLIQMVCCSAVVTQYHPLGNPWYWPFMQHSVL